MCKEYFDDYKFLIISFFCDNLKTKPFWFLGVAADGKAFTDPEVLRRLTSSVSSALDEAAAALTRMRSQAATSGAVSSQSNDQGKLWDDI